MRDNPGLERKIIDAIYSGACDASELLRAIELIRQYFDGCGSFFCEFDPAAPEEQLSVGIGTIDAQFLRDYAPFAPIDPAPEQFAALPTGAATTTDRMFSPEFLRHDVFLNEFLRPHGVDGTLGSPLLSSAGRFAIVAVHQGKHQKRFEADAIARLERLTPHLTRALQIRRLFLKSEQRGKVLETIINRNATAMIGISNAGQLLIVNDAARAIAAARDGIGLDRDGRPVLADRHAAVRLAQAQSAVATGGAGALLHIQRPSGKPPYLVLVSPLPRSEDTLLQMGHSGILIAIHDPARRVVPSAQRVAHFLHVPLGAAKLIEAILAGVELKDYAEREGISLNTVKFHLKTAFDRTGTRSQTDLVRLALLAIGDLDPYSSA
jgi:hypothetical protein